MASSSEGETFPLAAGMRDLLPLEAHVRRFLARTILEHVELHGYSQVLLPAFELASVLERGLGTLDPADVIRFVEPGSGEIAALRPDMTPQVARMVASRMRDLPPPIRVAYEGTVLRRRQERARRHRQIPQAGVELLGVNGPTGDLEVLRLAVSSLRALGIERFVIDVGHARVVRSLLEPFAEKTRMALLEALSVKDEARTAEIVASALREANAASAPSAFSPGSDRASTPGISPAISPAISPEVARAVTRLPSLHGPVASLAANVAALKGTPAEGPAADLVTIVDALCAMGLGDLIQVDLGEVRGFAYYTGFLFHLLADGPGAPLGGGGRYDELLSGFGVPMPAVGFALDLDHVAWARTTAGLDEPRPRRVLIVAPEGVGGTVATALRARGISAVVWRELDDAGGAASWKMEGEREDKRVVDPSTHASHRDHESQERWEGRASGGPDVPVGEGNADRASQAEQRAPERSTNDEDVDEWAVDTALETIDLKLTQSVQVRVAEVPSDSEVDASGKVQPVLAAPREPPVLAWARAWSITAVLGITPEGECTLISQVPAQLGLDSGRGLWQPTGRTQPPALRHDGEDEHQIQLLAAWVETMLEEKPCPPS